MTNYRVRAVTVRECWANVEASSEEEARRLVLVALDAIEEQHEDDRDKATFDFPTPMDELAVWVDLVRIEEVCRICGEALYGRIRVHHHNDPETGVVA